MPLTSTPAEGRLTNTIPDSGSTLGRTVEGALNLKSFVTGEMDSLYG